MENQNISMSNTERNTGDYVINSSTFEDGVEVHDDVDTRCGYGYWKPYFLQRFANSKALLCAIGWFAFVQGMYKK